MKNFRDILVWEKSHRLVLAVYESTTSFPKAEQYGLTSQIRRSASSIPSNIAEGACRGSDADFARFLQYAMGSASELEYQLLLAQELNYLAKENYLQLHSQVTTVKRMLTRFLQKIRS